MTDGTAHRVAGHVVELSGDSIGSRALMGKVFSPNSPVRVNADMTLHAVEPGSIRPPRRPPDRTAHHVSIWHDADHLTLATGPDQLARVGPDWAELDPGQAGDRGVHALLAPVLTVLFAARDLCVVHAAAVLDRGADGAVLGLGGSGQGKSTLVTAALSGGRVAISDDLVVIRRNPDRSIDVSGVPQPLALPADLASSEVVGPGIAGDHRQRRAPAAAMTIDTGWHPVRAVVLVEHSLEPNGHLRRADAQTTMFRVLASTLDGPSEGKALGVFPYATAIAGIAAWHLGHAATASSRVASALRWLDEIDELTSVGSEA